MTGKRRRIFQLCSCDQILDVSLSKITLPLFILFAVHPLELLIPPGLLHLLTPNWPFATDQRNRV